MRQKVITIDGYSGVGKTELGRGLAGHTGFHPISLGIFFRAITYGLSAREITPQQVSSENVEALLEGSTYEFHFDTAKALHAVVDGRDVTAELSAERLAAVGAQFAAIGEIRQKVWSIARDFAEQYPIIVDGRIAGSHIFPDAFLKFLLHADFEICVDRVWAKEVAAGRAISREEIHCLMVKRFEQETENHPDIHSMSSDMLVIDTGQYSQQQVLDLAIQHFHDQVGF